MPPSWVFWSHPELLQLRVLLEQAYTTAVSVGLLLSPLGESSSTKIYLQLFCKTTVIKGCSSNLILWSWCPLVLTQCEVPRQTPQEPLPPFAVGSDHQAPGCACPFTVPAFPWSTSGILCVRDGVDLSRDMTLDW